MLSHALLMLVLAAEPKPGCHLDAPVTFFCLREGDVGFNDDLGYFARWLEGCFGGQKKMSAALEAKGIRGLKVDFGRHTHATLEVFFDDQWRISGVGRQLAHPLERERQPQDLPDQELQPRPIVLAQVPRRVQ